MSSKCTQILMIPSITVAIENKNIYKTPFWVLHIGLEIHSLPLPWRYWLTHWVTTIKHPASPIHHNKACAGQNEKRLSCFLFIMTVVTKLFDVLNLHINEQCSSRLFIFCFIFLSMTCSVHVGGLVHGLWTVYYYTPVV